MRQHISCKIASPAGQAGRGRAGYGGRGRAGYTLMEIVVALAIGILLLAAVYVGFSVTLHQVERGRALTNRANIARAVFTRFNEDIANQMAPIDTRLVRLPGDLFAEEGTAGEGGEGEQADSEEGNAAIIGGPAIFNMGVFGDSQTVTLFITQATRPRVNQLDMLALPDQKRVSYWIAQGPNGPLGLARQVVEIPTSDEALMQLPFQLGNQEMFVFAEQVVNIQFQYFDGELQVWNDVWDGSQTGDVEGKQPIGPPAAISILVEIAHEPLWINPQSPTRIFRHVVHIPTANGPADFADIQGMFGP